MAFYSVALLVLLYNAAAGGKLPVNHPGSREPGSAGTANKLHLECVADEFTRTQLNYHIWTDPHNTASRCIVACRQQHFRYSTLKNGVDCYCGNNEIRGHEEEDDLIRVKVEPDCSVPCPGNEAENCGGPDSNDLYRVPTDRRYLGCFNGNDPDLTLQWGVGAERTAEECILTCQGLNNLFAGVQAGGACYCGYDFGSNGEMDEEVCNMTCAAGYKRQNCGGIDANAMYMTERGLEMGQEPDNYVKRLYDDTRQMTQISMSLFNQHPRLIAVTTDRIALSVMGSVVTINETDCVTNCYQPCGDIYHPEGFDHVGEDLIVRTFHLNLQNLGEHLKEGVKRVFVYAQTVVMNANLNVDYALVIHTRELVLDQTHGALTITATEEAPSIGLEDMSKPLEPEMVFVKQAVMCARILLETQKQADHVKAFAMLDDVIHVESSDEELVTYIQSIRSYVTEIAGILRADSHYVPFYTKSHMSRILETYATEIEIYKDEFDRLSDRNEALENFIDAAEGMLTIYAETDIEEARAGVDAALVALERSNATFHALNEKYDEANATMEAAREAFERAIENEIRKSLFNAFLSYFKLVGKIIKGIIVSYLDPSQTLQMMKDAGVALKNFINSCKDLADLMSAVKELLAMINSIIDRIADINYDGDFEDIADDIETVVAMAVSVIEWESFKDNVKILMDDEEVRKINEADNYRQSMLELANWGKAIGQTAIEVAEALRVAVEKRLILKARIQQKERLDELLEALRNDLIDREIMAYAMMEQTYDVRADLNDALISFCQAYFYENTYQCKMVYRPQFGGSLKDLLLRINAARKDALLIANVPSTVSRKIHLVDTNLDDTCEDTSSCPIGYFRKHRLLHYEMPLDHADLWDVDKFKLSEIELIFEGLQMSNDPRGNTQLKMIIESTGQFISRSLGTIYHFVGKPVRLLYEYDLSTERITIRGDIYPPFRDIVSHVTPFTTWLLEVAEDRSHNIDVSQVSAITMVFHGSAVDGDE